MSLRHSMKTGLAQPELKMNGFASKNSTAFTSSSIRAVISATSALSAKCMRGANLSRLESRHSPFWEGRDAQKENNSHRSTPGRAASRHCAAAAAGHLPLHGQRRQEILWLHHS